MCPLFQCDNPACGSVDNSALVAMFWSKYLEKKPVFCSKCETGKWHGAFKKEKPKKNEDLINR